MKIEFEGQVYDLELGRYTLQQAMVIQGYTGMAVADWEDSLEPRVTGDGDDAEMLNPPPEWLKSIAAVYWLMKTQAGQALPIAEVDFEVAPFMRAFYEAVITTAAAAIAEQQAAAAAAPALPPTRPGGPTSSTRGSRTTTTRTSRARKEPTAAPGTE